MTYFWISPLHLSPLHGHASFRTAVFGGSKYSFDIRRTVAPSVSTCNRYNNHKHALLGVKARRSEITLLVYFTSKFSRLGRLLRQRTSLAALARAKPSVKPTIIYNSLHDMFMTSIRSDLNIAVVENGVVVVTECPWDSFRCYSYITPSGHSVFISLANSAIFATTLSPGFLGGYRPGPHRETALNVWFVINFHRWSKLVKTGRNM